MSWAAQRRALYILGFLCIMGAVISFPAYSYLQTPPSCSDGKQNGWETAIDMGGTCAVLDGRELIPITIQWVRPFYVQEGQYSAVAYLENPNENAGVAALHYELRLYDEKNVLVAVREGKTFIMPGSVTPLYEGRIETGARSVTRAFLDILEEPRWERMNDVSRVIAIENKKVTDPTTAPRINAVAHNTSIAPIRNPSFVAVVFDTAGNAFAGSQTAFERLETGMQKDITFTWSKNWPLAVGRVDVIPKVEPMPRKKVSCSDTVRKEYASLDETLCWE